MYNISHFFISKPIIWAILSYVLLSSCTETHPYDVDCSSIDVSVKIHRLDSELFHANIDSLDLINSLLYEKYGTPYKLYIEHILRMGLVRDSAIGYYLKRFLTSPDIMELYHDVELLYPSLMDIEMTLTDAFKRYHYFFPERVVPEVFSFVSGLEYQNVAADSCIFIGLDMYLGSGNKFYKGKEFPLYKQKKMRRAYIATDCVKNWLATEFIQQRDTKTLLDQMIFHGKVLYLMDVLLPDVDDSIKIGYTNAQLKWCEENEREMWGFFVEHKLFFTSKPEKIIKFIGEGPFTKGFPKGSPAETGKWMGWQIVRSYMKKHADLSPSDLMKITQAQKIFQQSGYKPS